MASLYDMIVSLTLQTLTEKLAGKYVRSGTIKGQIVEFEIKKEDRFAPERLLMAVKFPDGSLIRKYPFTPNPNPKPFGVYRDWEIYNTLDEMTQAEEAQLFSHHA